MFQDRELVRLIHMDRVALSGLMYLVRDLLILRGQMYQVIGPAEIGIGTGDIIMTAQTSGDGFLHTIFGDILTLQIRFGPHG